MTLDAASAQTVLADAMLAGFRRAVEAVAAASADIADAARRLAEVWRGGGRCVYLGAGASGLVAAEDAAELPGTFGLDEARIIIRLAGGVEQPFHTDAAAEDDAVVGEREIRLLGDLSKDAVIAVSASGSTPYTLGAVEAARARGAFVIGIANRAGSPLLRSASAPILLDSGEEAVQGSTRLAAGVAQKCALGMLSTRLGLELGHVHRGLMVNLRADNDKLRRRALGIVATLADIPEERARAALHAADGDVKQAVLIAHGAAGPRAAGALLAAADGRLELALKSLRG